MTMNEEQKENLLAQFQDYLEQNNRQQNACITGELPDLNTLLTELSGLKAEVKAESRQFKNTLDTLSSALAQVEDDKQALSEELAFYKEQLEKQRQDILRTLLLDFLDIYDSLAAGLDRLQHYQPVHRLFKHSQAKDVRFIERFKEGQVMSLRRLEQLLQRYQVQAVESLGKPFDPVTMNAVETGWDESCQNGIVLEELRKGFLFQNQVLRLAEVKVNKSSTSP